MTAAFAVPGNTASTVLTRFFGSGLAGDLGHLIDPGVASR